MNRATKASRGFVSDRQIFLLVLDSFRNCQLRCQLAWTKKVTPLFWHS